MNKKEFTETKDFLKDYVDLKPIQTIILIFFFVMLTVLILFSVFDVISIKHIFLITCFVFFGLFMFSILVIEKQKELLEKSYLILKTALESQIENQKLHKSNLEISEKLALFQKHTNLANETIKKSQQKRKSKY